MRLPRFEVFGLPGMPEIRPGDDLVEVLTSALTDTPPADGDILLVTSKIVSKSEGRIRTIDRDDAIDAEAVRTVSEWTTPNGRTRIVETRHGFVMAAAGVDASNVDHGTVALLPLDPNASARALRDGLSRRFGTRMGVVVTDTAGRTWRNGVVDFAVGAAGVQAVDDLRGQRDRYGNDLGVTVVAVADELAAASELVRTKLSEVPVAVVRGLEHLLLEPGEPDTGAAPLVRPSVDDRFRLGTPEAMRAAVRTRPSARRFEPRAVDRAAVHRAVAAAMTAASPAVRDAVRFIVVESEARRTALVEAMGDVPDDRRGTLRSAPCVIVPCLIAEDPGVSQSLSAAVEGLRVALGADGIASAWWLPEPALCSATATLDLPDHWSPAGAIAAGYAAEVEDQPAPVDITDLVSWR